MLARAAFYPTLLYNVLMEKVSARRWYDRIDDTVVLGALPFRGMTSQLVTEENIRGVVTLNEEYETKYFVNTAEEWRSANVEQLRLDTPDLLSAPTQTNLTAGVGFLLQHRDAGTSVYVHCKAGRTRSATVVGCYLMQVHGWSPKTAVEFIRSKRPHIIIRRAQWDALDAFHRDKVLDTAR